MTEVTFRARAAASIAACGRLLAGMTLALAPLSAHALETDDYLEALRPRMEVRALDSAEQAALPKLLSAVKAAPTEALLDALRPFAVTGDEKAMRAMMDGYVAITQHPANQASAKNGYRQTALSERASVLAALWGVALWETHGADRAAAQQIASCLGIGMYRDSFEMSAVSGDRYDIGIHARAYGRDCGYDVLVTNFPSKYEPFHDYAKGDGPAPKATFTMRRLSLTPQEAAYKFESILARYGRGENVEAAGYWWAQDYAKENGPDAMFRYEAALRGQFEAARAAEAARSERWEAWRVSQIPAWEAMARTELYSREDIERFESLSALLGGQALIDFGKRYAMGLESNIEAVCRLDRTVCAQQVALYEARAAAARAEELARESLFRPGAASSAFTEVRMYDQSGNFVGTTSMTYGQAETAAGH